MNLEDYMTREGLTDAAFAEKISVDAVTVGRYRRRERMPRREIMKRINAETSGAVTADDFFPPVTPTEPKPEAGEGGAPGRPP